MRLVDTDDVIKVYFCITAFHVSHHAYERVVSFRSISFLCRSVTASDQLQEHFELRISQFCMDHTKITPTTKIKPRSPLAFNSNLTMKLLLPLLASFPFAASSWTLIPRYRSLLGPSLLDTTLLSVVAE